jgi:hypothetical protein
VWARLAFGGILVECGLGVVRVFGKEGHAGVSSHFLNFPRDDSVTLSARRLSQSLIRAVPREEDDHAHLLVDALPSPMLHLAKTSLPRTNRCANRARAPIPASPSVTFCSKIPRLFSRLSLISRLKNHPLIPAFLPS